MCSRYATLCNSSRTSTFEYYVSNFETKDAEKRPPRRARLWRRNDSRLFISSIHVYGIMNREWPEQILSPRRLSLPILSLWLPSRLLRAQLWLPPYVRHGRNRD